MKLIIEDDEGRKTVVPVVRDEITIGRNEQCMVRLTEKNVSRKHGRLLREQGHFYIEDLNSFTGIRVNGEKIAGKRAIHEGDLIQISEYDLSLHAGPDEKPQKDEQAPATDPEPIPAKPAEADALADSAEARRMMETATIRLSDLKRPADPDLAPQDVPTAERPRLMGISGTYRGKALVLDRTPVTIGRSNENDIEIDHPSISRKHCRLHLDAGTWKVMDAESRNGVRVNGEPYAAIGLRHGDVLEIGHLRFAFVAAGQPFKLPAEFAPVSGITQPAPLPQSSSKGLFLGVGIGLALALAAGFLFLHRSESHDGEQAFALKAAEEAAAENHYTEALRSLEKARRAGAATPTYEQIRAEAESEEQFRAMESAAASQDWEKARQYLGMLAGAKTYYGAQAAKKADAITSGYVNLHVAAAALMKGKDNAGCLSEAQLALTANPQSADAQSLVEACKATQPQGAQNAVAAAGPAVRTAGFAPSEKRAPAPAAPHVDNDSEARRLVNDGNTRLVGQDYAGAVATYQKALALQPSATVLSGIYRSMGIAYTRQGDVEQGARYYKLYLPLCTNPAEKSQLQKVLDDYEAQHKG